MSSKNKGSTSERRTESLLQDLLEIQSWNIAKYPKGDLLLQNEYLCVDELSDILSAASKHGDGPGYPDAILMDSYNNMPVAIIEVKARSDKMKAAVDEACHYGDFFIQRGLEVLTIALAGSDGDDFCLAVCRYVEGNWTPISYRGQSISWIPNRKDILAILSTKGLIELKPTVPPMEILAARANEINCLLRESDVKDEFRPAVVAAIMLALWHTKGEIRKSPNYILVDINQASASAFQRAGKSELAQSLFINPSNRKLAIRARRIVEIFERLNVTTLTADHDYLGQLYETFFRYTGGNTIGQYFTPRHITKFMAAVSQVTKDDTVLDPSCGSGGFLIAAMDQIATQNNYTRQQTIDLVASHLIGFESEPITAALCVANMILRGDGRTGIRNEDCFSAPDFPIGTASVVLTNPPFPHQNTDVPISAFVARGLEGLGRKGIYATILPTSILVKKAYRAWRNSLLKQNTLLAVCELPDELFQPYASVTTSIIFLRKGVMHNPESKTSFVRIKYDGYQLKKNIRVERVDGQNQLWDAQNAILNKQINKGFSGLASIRENDEWAAGAYVPADAPTVEEIKHNIDTILRRLLAFYSRYSREILKQRQMISSCELSVVPYRSVLTKKRLRNASLLPTSAGTIGAYFDIYYGLKELHSRDGLLPGSSLIISPTEEYNGCFGWLDYPTLLAPQFITVAQTGSIGEAFIQLEPCAVNDDCLLLIPKNISLTSIEQMLYVVSVLYAEKWRFTYGRKLTPSRICEFSAECPNDLVPWITKKWESTKSAIKYCLQSYEESEFSL